MTPHEFATTVHKTAFVEVRPQVSFGRGYTCHMRFMPNITGLDFSKATNDAEIREVLFRWAQDIIAEVEKAFGIFRAPTIELRGEGMMYNPEMLVRYVHNAYVDMEIYDPR